MNDTNIKSNLDFQEMILMLDFCMGVVCPFCGRKCFDPEKQRGQVRLKSRCPNPECRKDPAEEKFLRKQEKKAQKKTVQRKTR